MQISKLELKNISYYKQGSQETPCYNATVYVNGKKAVEVSMMDKVDLIDNSPIHNLWKNGIATW